VNIEQEDRLAAFFGEDFQPTLSAIGPRRRKRDSKETTAFASDEESESCNSLPYLVSIHIEMMLRINLLMFAGRYR